MNIMYALFLTLGAYIYIYRERERERLAVGLSVRIKGIVKFESRTIYM